MCEAIPPFFHDSLQCGAYLSTGKVLNLPYSYNFAAPMKQIKVLK
jgi:hypothetical protein